jgi:hypothetical protein
VCGPLRPYFTRLESATGAEPPSISLPGRTPVRGAGVPLRGADGGWA